MRLLLPLALLALVLPIEARADSPIKPDEEVILFPTSAHLEGAEWVISVHGWIFEPEGDSIWRRGLVGGLRRALNLDTGRPDTARFRDIARWFLVDNERGKRVPVHIGGGEVRASKSGADGHFRSTVRRRDDALGNPSENIWIGARAITRRGDARRFVGRVQLVGPEGVSVISDIDDTIKVSEVTDKKKVLKNTFLRPFRAVPKMAQLYSLWAERGAVFHYVSASPWQLYPALAEFTERHGFPTGTFSLREFRVKDDRRWNLLRSPVGYKLESIRSILRRYPKRRFILVGDAFERDPEIFGEIARLHKHQVEHILIRNTANSLSPARMKAAFSGVGAEVTVFREPAEIPRSLP